MWWCGRILGACVSLVSFFVGSGGGGKERTGGGGMDAVGRERESNG